MKNYLTPQLKCQQNLCCVSRHSTDTEQRNHSRSKAALTLHWLSHTRSLSEHQNRCAKQLTTEGINLIINNLKIVINYSDFQGLEDCFRSALPTCIQSGNNTVEKHLWATWVLGMSNGLGMIGNVGCSAGRIKEGREGNLRPARAWETFAEL